ncbi:MAG: D-alanyl-D-alanine carboxypeptidase family protein [Chlamydiota bacterium]
MSRITLSFLSWVLLGIIGCAPLEGDPLEVSVKARAAILINADSGAILYQKNAHKKMYPASITKLATAVYSLDNFHIPLDTKVTATQNAIGTVTFQAKKKSGYTLPAYWGEYNGTHMNIKKGEQLALKDLYYGILIASANDAANMISEKLGGTIPEFIDGMNSYLVRLGCRNTHFMNPHGLHHPNHYTTAYDMAIIARQALKQPLIREIALTTNFRRPKTAMQSASWMVTTNELIKRGELYYPYAIGLKTGYHSQARHTFVAAADKNGRVLVAVLLDCKDGDDKFRDATKLFKAAYSQHKIRRVFLKKGPQTISRHLENSSTPLKTYTNKDLDYYYYPAEEPQLEAAMQWKKLQLPITKGQKVGDVYLRDEHGKILDVVELFASNSINDSWWSGIKKYF